MNDLINRLRAMHRATMRIGVVDDLEEAAAALESQARRIAELERALRDIADTSIAKCDNGCEEIAARALKETPRDQISTSEVSK